MAFSLLEIRKQGLMEVRNLSVAPSAVFCDHLSFWNIVGYSPLCILERKRGKLLRWLFLQLALIWSFFLDTICLQQFPVLLSSYFMVFSLFSPRIKVIDSMTRTSGLLVSSWGSLKSFSSTDTIYLCKIQPFGFWS